VKRLALLLTLATFSVLPARAEWDFDSTVQLLVQDWRYVATKAAAATPPEVPLTELPIVTLPWSPERTRAGAWFIAELTIPEVWGGKQVVLSLEAEGPVTVMANGALVQEIPGMGTNELSLLLPPDIQGGDPIVLALGMRHGDKPAQLTKVKLQGEPRGLTEAMSAANVAFDGLKDYAVSLGPWKRMVKGPDDSAFKPEFDDAAWEVVKVNDPWEGDQVPAWYRARLTVPTAIADLDTAQFAPLLALDFDDPGECYINGVKVEPVGKDTRGSIFALPEGVKPGDEIFVAARILNRWGSGKLRQAAWRVAAIDAGYKIKLELQEELNRLATWIRSNDQPRTEWVAAIEALTTPLTTASADMTTFTATLQATQTAVAALKAEVQSDPVLLLQPYLQDLRPDEITVVFETSAPLPSTVRYGVDRLNKKVTEESTESTIHTVVLSDLKPATTYQYQVAVGRQETKTYTFTTAPDGPAPFNFIVWADHQGGYRMTERVARAIGRDSASFVISVGDVVNRGINWDEWSYQYLIPARYFQHKFPSYIAMGNHEYGGFDGNPDVPAFDHYFKHPDTSPGSTNYYYSFVHANAHFIVLEPLRIKQLPHADPALGNTVDPTDPQIIWLEKELKDNQGKYDWTFVFFHEPAYAETWSGGYYDGEDFIRNGITPMLEAYDVDFTFSGHTHAYERGFPHPADGPNNVIHIINGGGGGSLDNHKYKEWDQIDLPDHPARPDSDEPDEGAYYRHHYLNIAIDGKKLDFKAQEVLPNGRLGGLMDDFRLEK
jgi:hypothetical protein